MSYLTIEPDHSGRSFQPVCHLISLLLIFLLSACNRDGPLSTDTPIDQLSRTIDHTTPGLIKKYQITGLSIGVIRDGQLCLLRSFGHSHRSPDKKMEPNTLFRAASLGKPVFAYIVVALAEQGLLDLDTPLYSYFEERVIDDDPRSLQITARMILTHTSGLPNLGINNDAFKFHFTPGSNFKYSGHGYLYLQKVIEKLSGKSLEQLAKETVFKPLGMSNSSYLWHTEYSRSLAHSYDSKGKQYPVKNRPQSAFSAWSLFTTLPDYTRFVEHMIECSKDPDSIASKLLQPQTEVAKGVDWGLGWGLQQTRPHRSFWHWGSMAGYRHFVVAYPKEKLAVIVMSNNERAFKITDEIMTLAIGGSYPAYDWF
ncbi:MAG: beta-lactamase family protein [Candidatus Thiodiazotropha lotti]|nr:beta-lactamase family protein [Candidatus Thiodiazotropha lotti]MCG8003149.1 beta-lactamase family protein [Candidatus Thiodiazotropha lotti]MCW4186770.1 beta-lactamase family protein [Candidatus Thiodiazotropha lotti]